MQAHILLARSYQDEQKWDEAATAWQTALVDAHEAAGGA